MAFKSFDTKLKEAQCQLEGAKARMKSAMSTSQSMVSRNVDEMKSDLTSQYDPKTLIAQYPWASAGIGVAAGFILVPILKKFLGLQRPRRIYSMAPQPPQRVVVEVVGANGAKAKDHKKSPWGSILDAAMSGLPAVAAFVQQHVLKPLAEDVGEEFEERLHEKQAAREPDPAPAPQTAPKPVSAQPIPQTPKPQGTDVKFPKSMSRRSAPPPRES